MPLLNAPMTIGHIAVGAALGYLDFRLPERNWRAEQDHLADWFAGFSDLASMKATLPSG